MEPKLQSSYLKAINHILLREYTLKRVHAILSNLDILYWKYCCIRIFTASKRIPSFYNQLLIKLKSISSLQEELSVAIAHLRSLTIDVIESINKWRKLCLYYNGSNEEISIEWKNINYIIKISYDINSIYDYHVSKLWLGFPPNPFLLPPLNHNPKEIWENRVDKYLDWLKRSSEERKDKIKLRPRVSLTKAVVATTASYSTAIAMLNYDHNEFNQNSNNEKSIKTSKNVSDLQPESKDNSDMNHTMQNESESDHMMMRGESLAILNRRNSKQRMEELSTPLTNSLLKRNSSENDGNMLKSGAAAVASDNPTAAQAIPQEDITASVHTSLATVPPHENNSQVDGQSSITDTYELVESDWKALRDAAMKSWGSEEDPSALSFWNNFTMKASVVHAAVGFSETVPEKYIIPVLPDELVLRCTMLERTIMKETIMQEELEQLRYESEKIREEAIQTIRPLDAIVNEETIDDIINHKGALRDRQCQMLPSLSHALLPPPIPSSATANIHSSPSQNKSSQIFITATGANNHQVQHEVTFAPLSAGEMDAPNAGNTVIPQPLKISSHKLTDLIQRVENSRRATERKNGILCRRRTEEQRRRFESGDDVGGEDDERAHEIEHATCVIQRSVRKYLFLCTVDPMLVVIEKVKAAGVIQRMVRGWLGRIRAVQEKKKFRREIYILRKNVLRFHRSSAVIQRFMRWASYVCRKTKEKYGIMRRPSIIWKNLVKERCQELFTAAIIIQHGWRRRIRRINYNKELNKYALRIQMVFRRYMFSKRVFRRRFGTSLPYRGHTISSNNLNVSKRHGQKLTIDNDDSMWLYGDNKSKNSYSVPTLEQDSIISAVTQRSR